MAGLLTRGCIVRGLNKVPQASGSCAVMDACIRTSGMRAWLRVHTCDPVAVGRGHASEDSPIHHFQWQRISCEAPAIMAAKQTLDSVLHPVVRNNTMLCWQRCPDRWLFTALVHTHRGHEGFQASCLIAKATLAMQDGLVLLMSIIVCCKHLCMSVYAWMLHLLSCCVYHHVPSYGATCSMPRELSAIP